MKNPSGRKSCLWGRKPDYILVLMLTLLIVQLPQASARYGIQQELTSPVISAGVRFGESVANDDNMAVIGASYTDNKKEGTAYVYVYDGANWTYSATLSPGDLNANDYFGTSVAMDGNTIVVGTSGNAGKAYVFEYQGGVWLNTAKLVADETAEAFGGVVAVDGNFIVVGAKSDDDHKGSAYVFKRAGTNWVQFQKLTASDGEASITLFNDNGDQFGNSVAIDSNKIVVGAFYDDIDGHSGLSYPYSDVHGSAYVFEYDGSIWQEVKKLTASDARPHDLFGNTVDICGDMVVVGAYNADATYSDQGVVYAYKFDGTQWVQSKVFDANAREGDCFGFRVAIDSDTLVTGKLYGNHAVSIFKYVSNQWQNSDIVNNPFDVDSYFGTTLSIKGEKIIAASPLSDFYATDAGVAAAIVYTEPVSVYSGGDGTAQYPYQIADACDWQQLTTDPNNWNKQFILTADIDLADVHLTPVGNSSIPFRGVFDGSGYIIRNATMNMPDSNYVALFGWLSGKIANLGIVDCNIIGNRSVAGLLATNNRASELLSCYVTGSVTGNIHVGGLIGGNRATVSNCYSMADVCGNQYVGGLAGINWSLIRRCYSTGLVLGNTDTGGLVGLTNRGVNYNSYWNISTSGQTSSDGGRGKTTDQLKSADLYLGWGVENAWKLDAGFDYPRLIWESGGGENIIDPDPNQLYGGGTGTTEDPYLIYTAQQFNTIGLFWKDWDKHFKLMADIDLSVLDANSYNIIGAHYLAPLSFTGIFDGCGHTISKLNYTEGKYLLGIWGFIDSDNSVIQNLTIRDPQIIAPGAECVGNLAGYHIRGKIINCHVVNGTISAQANLGGLVGRNSANGYIIASSSDCNVTGPLPTDPPSTKERYGALVGENNGHIDQCCSSGSVYGNKMVGGLIGFMFGGQISNCYSTADVELGEQFGVGGLIGDLYDASVENCYSTGFVDVGQGHDGAGLIPVTFAEVVLNSFWDINTSGYSSGYYGTGKTTAQMKQFTTFTSAGWDFYGETANGTEDIWKMCADGDGYPKLWWEEGSAIPAVYYIDLVPWQQPGQDAYFFKAYDASTKALLTQMRWGQQIQLKYMIKNTGNKRAGQFSVSFYVSKNSTIGDADDKELASPDFFSGGLAADTYQAKTSSVLTLPSTPPSGYAGAETIYLGMKVDSRSAVTEANETNNYDAGIGIDKIAMAISKVNLTGYVKTSGGAALPGVTITAGNGGPATTTTSTGYYKLKVPYNWTGKITPTKTGYSFVPGYLAYAGLRSGKSSQNFTAYVRPTISGYVKTSRGTAISGVTIKATNGGGTTTTNSSGYYALKVPYKWIGTITPARTGYVFTPTKRTFATAVVASKASQNFTGAK